MLQSVKIDFGKAQNMIEEEVEQLQLLRDNPRKIIGCIRNEALIQKISNGRRRELSGERGWMENFLMMNHQDLLKQCGSVTFKNRKYVLEAFAAFTPREFQSFFEKFPTPKHVERKIKSFCQSDKVDPFQCANELFSFAAVFKRFNLNILTKDGEVGYEEEGNVNDDDGGSEDNLQIAWQYFWILSTI